VCREHGVLDGVLGVLCCSASHPREPVQSDPMTLVQLGERVAITGEMSADQVGVGAYRADGFRLAGEAGHGREH